MAHRKLLIIAALSLGIAGIVSVGGVLLSSIGPSAQARNDAEVILHFSPIIPGELQAFHVHGRPLFVFRPDPQQRKDLANLDRHVADKSETAYVPELDAFVYWGSSTNRGCDLHHEPPRKSMLLEYATNAVWLGGFWSPVCEVSYDYAGRAIKTYEFTFNGYRGQFPNLGKPKFTISGDTLIVRML